MHTHPIRFIRRGELVTLHNVAPSRTLLDVLREDLACTGTKEGCGEGDCGACTVVVGEAQGDRLIYRAVNSCIKLAHSIDGTVLWTVEDLAAADGTLHPAQQAMVQCHGSQCGFCTPGFVMSLFGMYQNHTCHGKPISRELAQEELSGNLCRCTGYKPILEAARTMGDLPRVKVDEARLLRQLQDLESARGEHLESVRSEGFVSVRTEPVDVPRGFDPSTGSGQARFSPSGTPIGAMPEGGNSAAYMAPRTLQGLLRARADHPQAQIVAGCTDVGLWVTKLHREFDRVLDVTRVAELRQVALYADHMDIGAAVPLADVFAALAQRRAQLRVFGNRFAGLPVRNAGTLGGNVANGSPIGDAMPLLIALRATVVLVSLRGQREMPLEALYTGYRKNVIAADEVLAWIKVPLPVATDAGEVAGVGVEFLRVYKISKRYDDDISAVCLALNLHIEGARVLSASIGAGGVAATPVRARKTEAALAGQPWTGETVRTAMQTLRAEFQPISDMRASAAYRSIVLGNLLQRFWLESQGMVSINLESFSLQGEAA